MQMAPKYLNVLAEGPQRAAPPGSAHESRRLRRVGGGAHLREDGRAAQDEDEEGRADRGKGPARPPAHGGAHRDRAAVVAWRRVNFIIAVGAGEGRA